MRFRKYAGLVAGAVVAGTMTIPMLASPASAAPSAVTVSRAFTCEYESFSLPYTVVSRATADGTAVTATMNSMPATSFPTGLKVGGFEATVGLSLGTEAVEVSGETTYATPIAGGGTGVTVSLPMPSLSGTRTGTDALSAGTITSLALTMKAGFQFSPAMPPPTMDDNVLECDALPEPITASKDYTCAYDSFSLPYAVTSQVTATGTTVTASLNDMPATSFPTGLKVAGFTAAVGVDLGGEVVQLTGENAYPTPIAGGGTGVTVALPMPVLTGTRTGTAAPAAGSITSLALTMKAGFQFNPNAPLTITDNVLNCIPVGGTPPVVTPPVVTPPAGPSAACTAAQGEQTKANAAVKSAQTKVTKTKKAVTKAKAKVKKAKKAAKKKATAKLKKAKKSAKTAGKSLKSAKAKSASAGSAVKKAC